MKILKSALFAAIAVFMVSQSQAQTCEELCDQNFWQSASSAEIATMITNSDLTARDRFDSTALHFAARFGSPESITLLLDAGADTGAVNNLYMTPFLNAAGEGKLENMAALLKGGVDIDARNPDSLTALMIIAGFGSADVLAALLDAGASLDLQNKFGRTALHFAAAMGDIEMLELLLNAGADGRIRDDAGATPFQLVENKQRLKGTDIYQALNDAQY